MKKWISFLLCMTMLSSMVVPATASETQPEAPVVQTETPVVQSETQEAPPATQPPHQHSWDGGTVTKEATCTESGVKTFTCACGETKTESIGTLGHSFSSWASADGSIHKRTCGKCALEESGPHGIATVVTTPATCLATGVKTHSCSDCGYSYTEEIPVSTTHAFGAWSATVETHGRKCADCGKEESGGHNFNAGEVSIPATCKEEGLWAVLCTTCEHIVYEVLPKSTTHTYDSVCDPDCNVCGLTRETAHNFSKVWTKGVHEHWHACTKCGEKSDIADHFPGPAATEEKAQLCLTCGYVMTAKLNHTHKFESSWTSDETGHWYACEGCEDQKELNEHSYDNACDADCNICGFVTENAHAFDENWQSDEIGHWSVCTVCGEVGLTQDHEAIPDTPEDESVFCAICDYEMAPAKVHTHVYGDEWKSNDTLHWQVCECGEKSDSVAHSWDEGTKQEDGTIVYLCDGCQGQRTEAAPESAFPWGVLLIALLVACAGAIAALIVVLKPKKGRFTK